jgi:hypothetical protein
MIFLTTLTCFSRRVAVLAVVLLAFVAMDSDGSITVTKTNNTGATVDGSSVDQTVNFSAADFAGMSTLVAKITVTITFSKASVAANRRPGYNEVGFTIGSATNSEQLIRGAKGNGTFKKGDKGTSFDGTITFDMDAADAVNVDKNLIQAGTFQPDAGNLNDFLNADALGDWTLNISDARNNGNGNTPLIVESWSVSITTIPEPDSIGLWGMAALLAAMIVFHRPRRRVDQLPTA